MKTHMEWRYRSSILDVGSNACEWPASPPRKQRPVVIEKEAGWALEDVWTLWRRLKTVALPGIELRFVGHRAHFLSLDRLGYPGSEVNVEHKRTFRPVGR